MMTAIIVAPNGAYKTKRDHVAIPMTLAEMCAEARQYADLGAAMVHVHVRDSAGEHTLDLPLCQHWANELQRTVGQDILVQLTTEAAGKYGAEEIAHFIAHIEAPAISVAISELFVEQHDTERGAEALQKAASRGTLIQYIVYSVADLKRYHALLAAGTLPHCPHHVLVVLGKYSEGKQASPDELTSFLRLPMPNSWAVCAFGDDELACLDRAIAYGGDVRIGFENNLLDEDGLVASSNVAQLKALKSVAKKRQVCIHNASEYFTFLKTKALAS
ncbi:3-keto-5-aminohexanoate cleavage protein [Thaumasiovibrio subtropicus]|uniref:3-keto-5-aminohexanoate cleavage protein n=1 Tax=Thaumasiovibrio subtropicus TaxID=1891207 RepID=UPI000B34AB32|nr:3-keto-5-aminohexanoate cleavage protein [Thaumasiovibrio subtropicus]